MLVEKLQVLNTQVLKNNPKVMEEFVKFYNEFNKFPKPDINSFFNTHFVYQLPIWLEFFNSFDIYIACVRGAGIAFFKSNPSGKYSYISNVQNILQYDNIDNNNLLSVYEDIIVRLVIKINNPF